MEVLKSKDQLCEIELGLVLGELLDFAEVEEHFSTCAQVHDEEEFSLRLEGPVKLDNEGVVQLLHDLALVENRLHFLLSLEFVLPHDLHGVESSSVFLSREDNSAEGSSSDDLDLLKIVSSHLVLSLGIFSEGQLGEMSTE